MISQLDIPELAGVGATEGGPPKLPKPNVLRNWVLAQPVNAARHAGALTPFTREQFGSGPASPSEAHVQAVNGLLNQLRAKLLAGTKAVDRAAKSAVERGSHEALQRVVTLKELAHMRVLKVEKVWDWYYELFNQRRAEEGPWLLACDRIAQDCYQYIYLGLGQAKSVPTPPPFSYMRTGFSPATYRRGIPLSLLGRQVNPFPLIHLPYHRLVNPWALGAVLHEVCHNIQSDLNLSQPVATRIAKSILDAGLPAEVARVWSRWNREMFADLAGLLLGGPSFVGSLMDVVGRSPMATYYYSPGKPHPIPYLRVLISAELLRRTGFEIESKRYESAWKRIYTNPGSGNIPPTVLRTFGDAVRAVIDGVCFKPFKELGHRALSQVIRFEHKEQSMIEEAAGRLASGTDPGIVPERFLIGAVRIAFMRRLASPAALAEKFFTQLVRR